MPLRGVNLGAIPGCWLLLLVAGLPAMAALAAPKPKVVIAGGGVIGCSTAYFLAKEHGIGCTIVDRKGLEHVEWADGGVLGARPMGDESTIAQVHPRSSARRSPRRPELAGAAVVDGVAAGLALDAGGSVVGLQLQDGSTLEADAVVLCLGPWSHALGRPATEPLGLRGAEDETGWGLAGLPPVVGTKYHAVLLQSPRVLNQAVFFQGLGDPEVYPRGDGETYVTGFPDPPAVVRDLPGETEVRADVTDRLVAAMNVVSSDLRNARVNHKQACHLPTAPDGVPVVGAVPGRRGAFVGTGPLLGHSGSRDGPPNPSRPATRHA
ncbi:hypothetical protein JL720_12938 [Aureococcus anophagefferens]|nr:hypothetical protein JL720_12938 [Aureococcus anophagefferens]